MAGVGLLRARTGAVFSSREPVNRRTEMSVFAPAEITYLQSQRLGRVATSGPGGQPHVVPVSFRYNAEEDTIDIGGPGLSQPQKKPAVQPKPPVGSPIDHPSPDHPRRPPQVPTHSPARP